MSLLWDADYNLICRCFHRRVGTIRVRRYCSSQRAAGRKHKSRVIAFGTSAGIGPAASLSGFSNRTQRWVPLPARCLRLAD